MTTEEKAKAYDEAIKRAKSKLHYPDKPCFVDVTEIFPELKESEDERIRKEIIYYLCEREIIESPTETRTKKDWISWLEKQGEQSQYWKPSKEQLDALDYAYNLCPDTERGDYYEGVLKTIIDDLHKLSEKQGEQKETLCDKCRKDQPSHSCQDITALGRCAVEHEQKTA